MPKISVIIPVFNGAKTIGRSIASVRTQTVADIEIVVADDCSSDDTCATVEALAKTDGKIKLVRLPENRGAGGARNAAIAQAMGEWIAVLDADDWYEPNRLEVLLKAARDFDADAVFDNLKIFDHSLMEIMDQTGFGAKNGTTRLTAETFFNGDNPLQRHPMGFAQPMIKRQFLVDHKITYNERYRIGEDFVLLAEVMLSGGRVFGVPGAYYVYVHRSSPTTRKASPHTRSGNAYSALAEGNNELMRKYGASMSTAARRALEKRRRLLESWLICQDFKSAVREKRLPKAVSILLTRPFVMVLIGGGVWRWGYANTLSAIQRLKKATKGARAS